MNPEPTSRRGASERELFLKALEQPTPADRATFLDTACGEDQALRQGVEELLREQAALNGFLETPALSGTPPLLETATEKPGDRIGRYKLLQKIGEGGAGIVYLAQQEEPIRRRVALKVIKVGMDTKSVIARFEAERQALAMMDHPNIARVFDAGAIPQARDRPFFVMELVRGVKITEYCDQNQLPTRERLALFVQVCQAIQHAHQKGVIHRDIKPSNILVTLHDGTPVPKVIDFGIAKAIPSISGLTNKTLFTAFTSFIGTPTYMSPEQAEMSGLDIDTRSDIYSLGVLLYELLTGKTPFDAEMLLQAGLDECRRTIREKEPLRPSTRLATLIEAELTTTARQRRIEAPRLIHLVAGDLDWIAMKCLEKDRTRRYPTANDLAADIQRYLNGEPVLARPPSSLYRFQKFVRRHRGVLAATTAIVITLIAGAGISAWQAVRAIQAERRALAAQQKETQLRQQAEGERLRAEQERASARLNEYVADINLAQQSLAAGHLGRAVQLLDKHGPEPGDPDLRGFEWRYLWQLCQGDPHSPFPQQQGPIQSLAVSPKSDLLAIGLREKFNVWSLRTQSLLTNVPKGAVSMAFFPDGQTLVTASFSTARAWNTTDWSERQALPENYGPIALSGDGTRLATCSRDGVRVWNTKTWTESHSFPGATGPLAFSPDGQTLATDSRAGLTLWPLSGGRAEVLLDDSTNLFARGGPWFRSDRVMAFSPDGKSLFSARNTLSERGVFVLSVWDALSGRELAFMPNDPQHIEHTGVISSLALSPDGRVLATASMDHSIRLWDLVSRQRLATLQGHLNEVWSVAFLPDGQTLVSGARDGAVKSWPMRPPQKEEVLAGSWQPLAFSKDSRTLATLSRAGTVTFLNLATREPEQQFQLVDPSDRGRFRFIPAVALSADLQTLVHGLEDGRVQLWNTDTREVTTLKVADRPVDMLALSPDGRSLITGGRFQPLRWWDLRSGTNFVLQTDAHRVLFSPDGRTLLAYVRGEAVELWDVATRSCRTNLVSQPAPGFIAAFSPDSRTFALVCFDDAVRLWDVATGQPLGTCTGHKQLVFSVAFAPDGRTLATTSDDSTLKLWNVASQQELLTIRRLGSGPRTVLFSPDGRLLLDGSTFFSPNPSLRFYRAPLLAETGAAPKRDRTE